MDYVKMKGLNDSGWTTIRQPDEDLAWNFETTYREDASRSYTGVMVAVPLFTVEQLQYVATDLTAAEVSTILGFIASGSPFYLHYFSPYYGTWRDDRFYVGKGSLSIGQLDQSSGLISSLSFNMQGVNPL